DQRGPAGLALDQQRCGLDSLAEAHVVRQASAEAQLRPTIEKAEPVELVGAQLGGETPRRWRSLILNGFHSLQPTTGLLAAFPAGFGEHLQGVESKRRQFDAARRVHASIRRGERAQASAQAPLDLGESSVGQTDEAPRLGEWRLNQLVQVDLGSLEVEAAGHQVPTFHRPQRAPELLHPDRAGSAQWALVLPLALDARTSLTELREHAQELLSPQSPARREQRRVETSRLGFLLGHALQRGAGFEQSLSRC